MAMGEDDKAFGRLKQALSLSPEDEEAKKLVSDIKSEQIVSKGGVLTGVGAVDGKK